MKKEILKSSVADFIADLKAVDLSAKFIVWYFKQEDKKFPIEITNANDFLDNLDAVGKKVYRGRLKQGDIVLFKVDDNAYKVGIYYGEAVENESVLSVEYDAGKGVIVERTRDYVDCTFIRPFVFEEKESKKEKKK